MELTKDQYRLLKKINRKKILHCNAIADYEQEAHSKLLELHYVSQYGVGNDGIDPEYYETRITEDGKMYIATRRINNRKFIIPVIISVAALIVSIMALYKSSQPIQINISNANTNANIEQTIDE